MTRPVNPATGIPYARRRPIDWETVRRILRWRQADRNLKSQGFQRVCAFAALPWESPIITHRIVEAAIHPDGMGLYVKLEARN